MGSPITMPLITHYSSRTLQRGRANPPHSGNQETQRTEAEQSDRHERRGGAHEERVDPEAAERRRLAALLERAQHRLHFAAGRLAREPGGRAREAHEGGLAPAVDADDGAR